MLWFCFLLFSWNFYLTLLVIYVAMCLGGRAFPTCHIPLLECASLIECLPCSILPLSLFFLFCSFLSPLPLLLSVPPSPAGQAPSGCLPIPHTLWTLFLISIAFSLSLIMADTSLKIYLQNIHGFHSPVKRAKVFHHLKTSCVEVVWL